MDTILGYGMQMVAVAFPLIRVGPEWPTVSVNSLHVPDCRIRAQLPAILRCDALGKAKALQGQQDHDAEAKIKTARHP